MSAVVEVEQDQVGMVLAGQVEAELRAHGGDQADAGAVAEDPLDQLEVGQVVLDVEDGEVAPVRRGRLGRGRLLLKLAPGLPDRGLGQAPGQGQAKAGALDPARLAGQPLEPDEQPLDGLGRDAQPGVGDLDAEPPAGHRLAVELDAATARLYLTAVDRRFSRTCLSRWRSPRTWVVQSSSGRSARCGAGRPAAG
jgi:hypothetical protein